MIKLYVTGKEPINIPQHGVRLPGEYFEMEEELARRYAEEHEGLSLYAFEVEAAEAEPEVSESQSEARSEELDTLFADKPFSRRKRAAEATPDADRQEGN